MKGRVHNGLLNFTRHSPQRKNSLFDEVKMPGNALVLVTVIDESAGCSAQEKKPSRTSPQQTNRYFHVLVSPLRFVNRKDPAAQEDHSSRTRPGYTGGRRSTDKEVFELYDCWLCFSPRERQVTYLTCKGYKNEQIAIYE
jgi:hypothetical protein